MGKGSPKPSSSQVVQTKTEIPEWFKPYMEDVFSEAQAITGIGTEDGPTGYEAAPGKGQLADRGWDRLADVDPFQTEALQKIGEGYDIAQGDLGEAITATKGAATGLPGTDMSQYMNPFQQAVTDINIREEQRRAAGDRTRVGDMAAKAGAFGGSRGALMEQEFERNLGQRLSDIQTRGSQAAYQSGLQQMNIDRQRQLQAAQQQAGLGLQKQQAMMSGLQGMLGAGGQRRALAQQPIDVGYGQFLEEREFPKENLGFYSGLIRGYQPPPARYAQTQTMSPYSGLQSGIGMAGALGSLGKGFGLFNKGGPVKLAFGGTPNQGYTEEMGNQSGLMGMMSGPMRFQNRGVVPWGKRAPQHWPFRHQGAIEQQRVEDIETFYPRPTSLPRSISSGLGQFRRDPVGVYRKGLHNFPGTHAGEKSTGPGSVQKGMEILQKQTYIDPISGKVKQHPLFERISQMMIKRGPNAPDRGMSGLFGGSPGAASGIGTRWLRKKWNEYGQILPKDIKTYDPDWLQKQITSTENKLKKRSERYDGLISTLKESLKKASPAAIASIKSQLEQTIQRRDLELGVDRDMLDNYKRWMKPYENMTDKKKTQISKAVTGEAKQEGLEAAYNRMEAVKAHDIDEGGFGTLSPKDKAEIRRQAQANVQPRSALITPQKQKKPPKKKPPIDSDGGDYGLQTERDVRVTGYGEDDWSDIPKPPKEEKPPHSGLAGDLASKLGDKKKGDELEPEWFKTAAAFATLIPGREKNWDSFAAVMSKMDSPEDRKEALAKAEYYGGAGARDQLKMYLKSQSDMNTILQKDRVLQKDLAVLEHKIISGEMDLNIKTYNAMSDTYKQLFDITDIKKLSELTDKPKELEALKTKLFGKARRQIKHGIYQGAHGGAIPPSLAKHGVTGLRSL